MISQDYIRQMARYNRWQNKSLMTAAKTLSIDALTLDRGAFFKSIIGTFHHLMWGDQIWMSRFDNWTAPDLALAQSNTILYEFDEFCTKRTISDARIVRWADKLDPATLNGELSWASLALGRDVSEPVTSCIMHFFNHQTHHRGQIHAMLTAAGAKPDDTDLFIMPKDM